MHEHHQRPRLPTGHGGDHHWDHEWLGLCRPAALHEAKTPAFYTMEHPLTRDDVAKAMGENDEDGNSIPMEALTSHDLSEWLKPDGRSRLQGPWLTSPERGTSAPDARRVVGGPRPRRVDAGSRAH